MVAHLLHRSGLYMGDSQRLMQATEDNQGGYWENWDFVHLNDEILAEAGGSWHAPPVGNWWRNEGRFDSLRVAAEQLIEKFADQKYWGWKDPRTSLTLPFWLRVDSLTMPFWSGTGDEFKIVVCLRHPLEVSQSLRDRQTAPSSAGMDLWLSYNRSILNHTLPEKRIVTHYDSYFDDPVAELRRVLNFIGMPVDTVDISAGVVSSGLRHKRSADDLDGSVPTEARDLYFILCEEAEYPQSI